ncbi:MAG: alpha-ketoacid dehydrogenase subunit beta [Bdellovibrionales bacterium]|nr:alpha-ketoacid dehydrogenase subunit beta [Bdellovibrionales bacterium]
MATMVQAIRMALHYGEKHLEVKDIFGQDVGPPLGGVFTATQGLKTTWNSPLDERGIIGTAIGIAMTGERCVCEIQFADYIFNTIDLLKLAGNNLWASHGQFPLPLVLMTPNGAGIHGSIYHSHSFDTWATRIPGWKIVSPSNALDAYGLMLSAILDPNPVFYLKPKALLRVKSKEKIPGEPESEKELKERIDAPIGLERENWKARWPKLELYTVPLGKARLVEEGTDITVVSYGRSLVLCEKAIQNLDISVELIDLRSLYPYDWQSIKKSLQKTGRILFVNEDTEVSNFGEHLAYRCTKEAFYDLLVPPTVLAGKQVPGIGLHPNLESATVPQISDIKKEIEKLVHSSL